MEVRLRIKNNGIKEHSEEFLKINKAMAIANQNRIDYNMAKTKASVMNITSSGDVFIEMQLLKNSPERIYNDGMAVLTMEKTDPINLVDRLAKENKNSEKGEKNNIEKRLGDKIVEKDLKEETKEDIAFISDYNKRMAEKKENNPYFNPNSPLNENRENTDIEYNKVSIKSNFYENLQKGNGEVLDSLIKNDHYNNTVLNEYVVEKIEKINETTKNLNGAFKIEYAPDKATGTILNNVGENYIESFEFRPVNNTEFMDKLSNLYNDGKSELDKIELSYENFGNLTDASTYDRGNRNSKLSLFIVGGKEEQNELTIVSGDKKLQLKGDEINLGEMMSMRNATTFLFDKEEEKVEKHIKLAYEIKNDVDKLKEDLLKQDFDTIKTNIYSAVLNNLEIKEKTDNFQKDTNNLEIEVMERFEDVFTGLGQDFRNEFVEKNAEKFGLTLDENGKANEIMEMNVPYDKGVNDFLRGKYMEEVHDFQERVLNFGTNMSTKIEDKFSMVEISGYSNNNIEKVEKAYEDLYEYSVRSGANNPKLFSINGNTVGLEIGELSGKFEKLDNKFNADQKFNEDKVVEEKEVEIIDGKAYVKGENKPFSGNIIV